MTQEKRTSRRSLLKLTAGGALLAGSGSFGLVLYKDQAWVTSEPYERSNTTRATTAAVVYSRSGNTMLAAKELARLQDADLFSIQASAYPQTFSGQMQASDDASNESRNTEITHPAIDFGQYQRVFLCSPTWWYRPAVPMWAFVAAQDFSECEIALLLTGNSRYEEQKIAEFGQLVKQRNGRFTEHQFIERGRVFWQLSADELRQQVRERIHLLS